MKRLYKILRAVLMTAVIIAVVVPAILYVGLSLPSVQNVIRQKTERILSEKTGAEVSIGEIIIRPFNRVWLRDAAVIQQNDTVLKIRRIGTGISVFELIFRNNITINYAELRGLDARLSRDSVNAQLNIQPIIDALQNKEKNKPPTKFDVRLNTLVIRDSRICYDVLSEPRAEGRFDPSHIEITDFRADVSLPMLRNDCYKANLRRLDFREHSGFEITNLKAGIELSDSLLSWSGLELEMPSSQLSIADGKVTLDGIPSLARSVMSGGVSIEILPPSHIFLPDLVAFEPELAEMRHTLNLRLKSRFNSRRADIASLSAAFTDGCFSLKMTDAVLLNPLRPDSANLRVPELLIVLKPSSFDRLTARCLSDRVRQHLPQSLNLQGEASLSPLRGNVSLNAHADGETIDLEGNYTRLDVSTPLSGNITINSSNLNLAKMLGNPELGNLNAEVDADFTIGGKTRILEAAARVRDFTFRRQTYDNLSVDLAIDGDDIVVSGKLYDDCGIIDIAGSGSLGRDNRHLNANASVRGIDLYAMNLSQSNSVKSIDVDVEVAFDGADVNSFNGFIDLSNITIENRNGGKLAFNSFRVENNTVESPGLLTVSSDVINGQLEGDYSFVSLPATFMHLARRVFPALLGDAESSPHNIGYDRLNFGFTMANTEPYREFFNLPVSAVYPVKIDGYVDGSRDYAQITVDAPYLRQKNKLIENTSVTAVVDGEHPDGNLYLTSRFPVKQGIMDLTIDATALTDSLSTNLHWKIDRKQAYEGVISFDARFNKLPDNRLLTVVNVRPTEQVFNDTVWKLSPAVVSAVGRRVEVDGFEMSRANQFVRIDGVASESPDDTLSVNVLDLNLDYIFESIGIENVQLGGDATGLITASALFSGEPRMETDGIDVKNISYNKCVLGHGTVLSHWNAAKRSVVIDGTIDQPNGKASKVEGEIFAFQDSLDINLICDEVQCGFMGYYMQAFASDVSGIGSGKAHLWGTFHDIDMEGDMYVKDLALKLNFTNTFFHASDSLHIRQGEIRLSDITLSDSFGHTALLNGVVHHQFFRNPTFKFDVTNASNLLVYDESSKDNPDWYGRIFANGKASVDGRPGLVKIDVDVSTAPNSNFTFVLSEMEIADEYTFLTFRDKTKLEMKTGTLEDEARELAFVDRLRAELARQSSETTSDYEVELRVDITPEAEIDLVMDPVAGDKIRSHGSGNLRMLYTSSGNDLQIWGKYTLEKGLYNFTLQDIIIKDFTIREGSSISFTGDPLKALLDIDATYSLNANLSDLDESFLQDKDLNRTNVPVYAVLKVTGDIQDPQISFDLEFPTLTSDIDRKVRSIISTDEMMNRQIIYLLALNRFYTPDYMASTTKGNEIFSVASSTLSSQLTSMLGQLSDNWAISPNFRSDRGDFSDVEVDLALSSRLLNNRLLLNGNFGYRDKSLNNNQFIGDFDLEYLLNKSGTIRLKAYNHFNDQNYYLRTATTTQGVGVVFKRDFDNIFSFLRPIRRWFGAGKNEEGGIDKEKSDSVPLQKTESAPSDSLPSGK